VRFIFAVCACALLAAAVPLHAQTLTNPDLSALGDMRFNMYSDDTAGVMSAEQLEFHFRELELNINAYLNPYMRADVFIGIHGVEGPVEVEEASMTVLRGLPLSLQLKAGKYLTDFGVINQQHPHQWAWLEWPLMHRAQFGPEGLRSIGANLSTFVALGETALTLSANAFSSRAFLLEHEHGEGADAHDHEDLEEDLVYRAEVVLPEQIMGSARVSAFRQLGDYWMVQAGVSALYGTFDADSGLKKRIAGADFKLRWRPSQYKALVFSVEAMASDSDVIHEDSTLAINQIERVRADGAFGQIEYQFTRRFDLGGFADWSQSAIVPGEEARAYGAWIGFMPVEETARFSIVYRHEENDIYPVTLDLVTLQFLFALGPHQPHTI
jgi:hypothetical protein